MNLELIGYLKEYNNRDILYYAVQKFMDDIRLLQSGLNDTMCKTPDYKYTLMTGDSKVINYGNCITSEVIEIMDSGPWKHWKKMDKINYDNIELELVDILHFTASIDIVNKAIRNDLLNVISIRLVDITYKENTELHAIDDLLYKNIEELSALDESDELNFMYYIINSMLPISATISNLYIKLHKLLQVEQDDVRDGMIEDIVAALHGYSYYITVLTMLTHIVLINKSTDENYPKETQEAMYRIYITKNTLNRFRTDNGYNTGEYMKIWGNEEDNVVAIRLAKELGSDITMDRLYDKLVIAYANL